MYIHFNIYPSHGSILSTVTTYKMYMCDILFRSCFIIISSYLPNSYLYYSLFTEAQQNNISCIIKREGFGKTSLFYWLWKKLFHEPYITVENTHHHHHIKHKIRIGCLIILFAILFR